MSEAAGEANNRGGDGRRNGEGVKEDEGSAESAKGDDNEDVGEGELSEREEKRATRSIQSS